MLLSSAMNCYEKLNELKSNIGYPENASSESNEKASNLDISHPKIKKL